MRSATVLSAALIVGGGASLGFSLAAQRHAPRPAAGAGGILSPSTTPAMPLPTPLHLGRSLPVSIAIPAIGVHSRLLVLGMARDGSIQVPPLNNTTATNQAGWFKYSPTPGQLGTSVIEGHIDSADQGPSVFFRLGALKPGDTVDVTLADGTTGVFRVDGIRQFSKSAFPTAVLYGDTGGASLRLVTCGGAFDAATHSYLANIIVDAQLVSAHHS